MIQIFWLFDFLGLFLARVIVGTLLIVRGLKKHQLVKAGSSLSFDVSQDVSRDVSQRLMVLIYFISGCLVIFGLYSSLVALIWLFGLGLIIVKNAVRTRKLFADNPADKEVYYLLAFFLILLFIGPGKLSLDRILDIRF